jgi:phytanoyl-CoA hydroxylase
VLTSEQIEAYHRDGFLVLEGFASPEACAQLRARAVEMVHEWQPSGERTVFTTDEQERASNHEFLSSGSTTWCFFEEEAFGPDGELRQPKELSINKIGHAMHDLDPVFERFTYTAELAAVAHDIGLTDPLALQSMYIFKQPGIGGEVGCHQDATFLYTDPVTVTGFWFALEDATLDNGCLWRGRAAIARAGCARCSSAPGR